MSRSLANLIAGCADPQSVHLALERWREAAGADADARLEDGECREALVTLLALGGAPASALLRDPGTLDFALAGPVRPPLADVEDRIRAAAGGHGTATDDVPLRRAWRREYMRVLLADAVGGASLEEVTGALSDLADATLRAVLDRELARAADRDGPPYHSDGSPAELTCLALGKLGGAELNYSSDIDLLFLRSGEGTTHPEDGQRPRSLLEHFSSVAQAVSKVLSAQTVWGHLYRVDLRLRPRGSAGAVVPRTSGAVHYYRSTGRTWERQMLLKARPVAGARQLGRVFLDEMEPWVYGRPVLSKDIAEIRRLKRTIEGGRDAHERNLKTGRGGIRDIEFVVQFLQLLLGNELPQVRSRATLDGLRRLVEADALQPGEARHLEDAYVFLRTAEHRVQTEEDQQLHSIPDDDDGVGRLALRMGFTGTNAEARAAFRAAHEHHTVRVREILDRLVHGAFAAEEERARRVVDLLLAGDEGDETSVHAALEPFGFRDPAAALADLRRMASAGSPFLPRTRTYFASAAPMLLSRAAATPNPAAALALVQRLSSRHAGSGLFFELLTENPDVLGVFCDLGGGSPYLSGLLGARPEIMDAFLDALVVGPRDALPPFEDLPSERLGDSDEPVEALRNLRDLALLRTGILDLQGRANARETARSLSHTASTVVRLATDAVCSTGEAGGGFAVLALGRLGAGEMAYGSDLDLMFVHDGTDPELQTRRGRSLAAMLGGTGSRGPLYSVDLRLRPEGKSGPLVTSLAALERYLGDRARTWERQALVRAAAVSGDPSTGERAMQLIHTLLHGAPPPPELLSEVRAMRLRVEANGTPGSLKTGRGGVQDAEFLAQGLVLAFGHEYESLRLPNTVDALRALRDEGVLRPEEYEGVITAYLYLRDVEMRIRVSSDASGSVFPRDRAAMDDLARRLGYVDTTYAPSGRSLEEEVDYYRDRLRVWFERVMTRLANG